MTLLIQDASCSLYICHSIHTWSYFTRSNVLLVSLVSYLSVYITVRFSIHSFQCSTYNALTFTFLYYCFLFSCVHLQVRFRWTFIFSASELEETDEPLFEGIQEDYQAWVWHFSSYILWHFFLLWCPDAKIVSSFISVLLCFQIL